MVSKSRDYDLIMNEGRKHEENYDWVLAADDYERALKVALKRRDSSEAAKVCEHIGLCYYRGASQAGDVQEFKSRMLQALGGYSRAAELFGRAEVPEKLARKCQCEAASAHVSSWLAPDFTSRKKLLEDCWKLEKEAIRFYRRLRSRVALAKAYNKLSAWLVERLDLERNKKVRQKILREALIHGDEAIRILSEPGDTYELARAYCITSIHCQTAAKGVELEKKSEYARKALNYSRRAVQLSERVGDDHLLSMSNIWAGSAIVDLTDHPDSATRHFQNALEYGTHARDHYLMGRSSYLIAHLMAWKMVAEEDPVMIRQESKKCLRYSQEAISNFKSIANDQEIACSYYWIAENYSSLARFSETSLKKGVSF